MKTKLLSLALMLSLIVGCSSDDDNGTNCDKKVFMLQETCDSTECFYTVAYGTTVETSSTTLVSEETFNYYEANFEPGETCWEGITPLD